MIRFALIALLWTSSAFGLRTIELTEKNSVVVAGDINPIVLANTVTEVIKKQIDSDVVYVVLYSPGGMIDGGELFNNSLSVFSKVEIVIIHAWSMAAAMSQCPKLKRLIHAKGSLMFHESYRQVQSFLTADELEKLAKSVREASDKFNKMCKQRMKLSDKQYKANISGTDWWLSAEDALKIGAAEEIVNVECSPGFAQYSPSVIKLGMLREIIFEPFCKILNDINKGP